MKRLKRIVDTGFWNDEKVMEFSPEDKYFMLFLLTNEYSSQLGIYHLPLKKAAFDLGYSEDVLNTLLERFENKYRLIKFSSATCEIAIKNYLIHSIVSGGKPVYDCLIKETDAVKDKNLLAFIYDNLSSKEIRNETVKGYLQFLDKYLSDHGQACGDSNNPFNDNEDDNDNERYVDESSTNREKVEPITHNKGSEKKDDYEHIRELWNSLDGLGNIKGIRSITTGSKRRNMTRARIKEYGMDGFAEAIENIKKSDFLQGKNNRGWAATFDWLILPNNFPKVLEGNYENRTDGSSNKVTALEERLAKIETWR